MGVVRGSYEILPLTLASIKRCLCERIDGQGVPVADAQPTLRIPEIVVGGAS